MQDDQRILGHGAISKNGMNLHHKRRRNWCKKKPEQITQRKVKGDEEGHKQLSNHWVRFKIWKVAKEWEADNLMTPYFLQHECKH